MLKFEIELSLLKRGSKGVQVITLQHLLIKEGYSLGDYGIDGDFGSATEKAVKKYQSKHGLDSDGIVGLLTWSELLRGI